MKKTSPSSTPSSPDLSSSKVPALKTDQPWNYSFLGLMRQLSARHTDLPSVGKALRPQQEIFRLGQKPGLTFAPREIADIEDDEGVARIRLFGLGLLGPNGPMPLQFTDFVRDRSEMRQDKTLANFLDIFHHRYFSSLFRAWAINQSTAGLDRPEEEQFSNYIDAIGNTESSGHATLPRHALLAASAHLVQEARHPDGLVATLSHFFQVPVALEEYTPNWIDINSEDQTRLGRPGISSLLGEGSFAGEKVFDRQHHFSLVIGPLSLETYLSLTPTGKNLPSLIEWVRAFVGFEFSWDVKLTLSAPVVPQACIGGVEQLGWSTWLGKPESDQPVLGLVFNPESANLAASVT